MQLLSDAQLRTRTCLSLPEERPRTRGAVSPQRGPRLEYLLSTSRQQTGNDKYGETWRRTVANLLSALASAPSNDHADANRICRNRRQTRHESCSRHAITVPCSRVAAIGETEELVCRIPAEGPSSRIRAAHIGGADRQVRVRRNRVP